MFDPFSIVLLSEGMLFGPMLAGSVLYNKQRYPEAARAFEFAARLQPLPWFRATCYINLSACHAEMAQPELTIEACDRAEKSSGSRHVRALAHINRAHAYLLLGRMVESQSEAERAIELSPHWRNGVRYAMVNYADAMGRMGRYTEALQIARQALHGGGESDSAVAGAARREIAMLLIQMGRPRTAMQEMEQALQAGLPRADHRGLIYQLVAQAWLALGEAEEASRALDEAERLGVPPVNIPVLMQGRAKVAQLQGQYDQAVALLRSAESAATTPLVKLLVAASLASCLCKRRNYTEALARAQEVLDHCEYRHIRAICYVVQARTYFYEGDIHEGCVALENLRTFQGMSPVLDADIAMAHCHGSFEADHFADAANWASVALRFLDDTEGYPHLRREAQLWLARSMTRQGQAAETEQMIADALQSTGVSHTERADLLHALGEAHLARGDVEAAENNFRDAVNADPDCARAYFSLGQRLVRRDQLEDGEQCLRAAQAADPEGTWGRDAGLALQSLEIPTKGTDNE